MVMIKFNIQSYAPVDEGDRTLEITEAKCTPSGKPSKIELTFKDVITNRTLKSSYGFTSEGAMRAFAFLCRTALNLPDMGEFDTVADTPKLVGKKLLCEVVHTEGTQPREDGTLPIFANISKVKELIDEDTTTTTTSTATSTVTSPRNSIPTGDLD